MGTAFLLLCSPRKGQAAFISFQNFYCFERAFISSNILDVFEIERNSLISSPTRQQSASALIITVLVFYVMKVIKGKAVPLQAWSGPEDSRKLRFPDYMTKP